jgi:hypothetical protein
MTNKKNRQKQRQRQKQKQIPFGDDKKAGDDKLRTGNSNSNGKSNSKDGLYKAADIRPTQSIRHLTGQQCGKIYRSNYLEAAGEVVKR